EHPVEAQLAGRRRLLEQGRAHRQQRDRPDRADRRRAARAAHVARLPEAVAAAEHADDPAAGAYRDLAGHDDVEAVVEIPLADDLVAVAEFAPLARAQNLPDLRVRELVEEAQLAQLLELRLLVDPIRLRAQRLEDAGQRSGELEPVSEALLRLLAERRRDDVLHLLGDLLA